ncbi:PLP-dependent aminotransferase family protein [Dactylosporangium sp. NPDC051484]|uniref:aminotransferase-like domain-containing protein n=1 Tax=Dactylosporangium sp. NPDC051484 TaxID=3154942 RepID=UPI00344E6FD5
MRPATYKAIVDRLATAIRTGELPAGTRLPTHRTLAREHRIALATATRVYAELTGMGLVAGEPGRGTFVRDQHGHDGLDPDRRLPVPRIADLSFNQPLADEQTTQLRHALRELSTSGNLDAVLYQQPPGGRSHERAIVATYLLDRGIDVPPASVFLTNGAQQALDAVLATTTRPGEVVAADALTYPGLKLLAATHSLEIAPIPSTADGPDLDALNQLCAARPVRAIYTIPTLHNPLGWTLSHATRDHLATIARTHDVLIIEDGTYAFLDQTPPPPIQAIAPERTFYIASLSKNVATGLRFGFAIAPGAHASSLTRSLRATTWGIPGIVTALATGWIADGTVGRLEKTRRDDAASRQQIARTAFTGLDYTAHPSSFFGWLRLPHDLRADQAATHLADAGVLVSTADAFATTTHPPHALRLAIATPPLPELADILEHVRTTIDSIPW